MAFAFSCGAPGHVSGLQPAVQRLPSQITQLLATLTQPTAVGETLQTHARAHRFLPLHVLVFHLGLEGDLWLGALCLSLGHRSSGGQRLSVTMKRN
jgi:hypothetical protein